jgi:general secretion pathway protein M
MMAWVKSHRRSAAIVLGTLLIPSYIFLSLLLSILAARSDYARQIDSIEPRLARMQGLLVEEETLKTALADVRTITNDHVYRKATDAEAVAASLQADARRIMSDAGMAVTNSQVLPVRKRAKFDYISVKVVAQGTLEELEESLGVLARFRPVVFVETIDAFPNRRRGRDAEEEQRLTVSLELLSLRIAS